MSSSWYSRGVRLKRLRRRIDVERNHPAGSTADKFEERCVSPCLRMKRRPELRHHSSVAVELLDHLQDEAQVEMTRRVCARGVSS